jgi:hypothetical protein
MLLIRSWRGLRAEPVTGENITTAVRLSREKHSSSRRGDELEARTLILEFLGL